MNNTVRASPDEAVRLRDDPGFAPTPTNRSNWNAVNGHFRWDGELRGKDRHPRGAALDRAASAPYRQAMDHC